MTKIGHKNLSDLHMPPIAIWRRGYVKNNTSAPMTERWHLSHKSRRSSVLKTKGEGHRLRTDVEGDDVEVIYALAFTKCLFWV